MHIIDKSECIECGFCANICPRQAIEEKEIAYEINSACVDCGLCIKNCPVNAISKVEK